MMNPTTVQAARAANIVYSVLLYRRGQDREEMPPVCIVSFTLFTMCCNAIITSPSPPINIITARCTFVQSAVLPSYVVCLSVCLSVRDAVHCGS